MVRQNSNELIAAAFRLADAQTEEPVLVEVQPELIAPRTIYRGPFGEVG
jgi:LacI family transcriptional regulator, fructose operon transcriptional repressor